MNLNSKTTQTDIYILIYTNCNGTSIKNISKNIEELADQIYKYSNEFVAFHQAFNPNDLDALYDKISQYKQLENKINVPLNLKYRNNEIESIIIKFTPELLKKYSAPIRQFKNVSNDNLKIVNKKILNLTKQLDRLNKERKNIEFYIDSISSIVHNYKK